MNSVRKMFSCYASRNNSHPIPYRRIHTKRMAAAAAGNASEEDLLAWFEQKHDVSLVVD